MNFQDFKRNFKSFKPEAQKKGMIKVLENLIEFCKESEYPEDIEMLMSNVADLIEEIESNDGFGTEGMKL